MKLVISATNQPANFAAILLQGDIEEVAKEEIKTVLNSALPTVFWQNNINEKQWLKLAINCVINPLTALYDCNNGDILLEKFKPDIEQISYEVIEIARVKNIHLSLNILLDNVRSVADKTADNCSSMRSDILAKRKTEIDHINGFIHQQGKTHSISTPMNSEMWQEIKQLEAVNARN